MKKVFFTGLLSIAFAFAMTACNNNNAEPAENENPEVEQKECCERPVCECACTAEGGVCECCPMKEEKCGDAENCLAYKCCKEGAEGEKPCCKEGAEGCQKACEKKCDGEKACEKKCDGDKQCCKKEGEGCPKANK